jgi:DNA-binding NarL/FixJ family response regulator
MMHRSRADRFEDVSAFRSKEPTLARHGAELVSTDVLQGWTVLVYAQSTSEVVMLRSWVASLGGTTIRLEHVTDAAGFISRNASARIALVLEARRPDLEDRIEECIDLRARFPGCPIILMSETFGTNDFSTERMAVCDASLRSPVSQVAFKLAIPSAIANNRYFVSRSLQEGAAPEVGETVQQVEATEVRPVSDRAPVATRRSGSVLGWRIGEICVTCAVGVVFGVGLAMVF